MKNALLLGLGGGVGFVLGARAGRPAYDRLMTRWNDLAGALGLGQLAATVKEASIDVRDTAMSKASEKVSSTADVLNDRVGQMSGSHSDEVTVVGVPGSVGEDPGLAGGAGWSTS